MRIGVGMFTAQRPPGSPRTHQMLYADLLRHAQVADDAGLDSFWVAEHHFAEDGYMTSVLPVCAAIAAVTSRLTIGTSVLSPSLYHPVRLAEEAITLDLLSAGRFILGLGQVYRAPEFQGYGVEPESDVGRLEETFSILRKAFSGTAFSHSGRYYQLREVQIMPAPYTSGGPPMMLAGNGVTDRDAVRAAESGTMYMIDPSLSWDAVVRLVELYDRHVSGNAILELPLFSYGYVTASGDPWEEMRDGFSYLRRTYDDWMGRPKTPVIDPRNYRLLLGDPGQLAEQIRAYHRQFGDRLHFILRLSYPGQDPDRVERAIRLYGDVAATVKASLARDPALR